MTSDLKLYHTPTQFIETFTENAIVGFYKESLRVSQDGHRKNHSEFFEEPPFFPNWVKHVVQPAKYWLLFSS